MSVNSQPTNLNISEDISTSEMTYIVSSGALNFTHSLLKTKTSSSYVEWLMIRSKIFCLH